jgi:hypothetical protein
VAPPGCIRRYHSSPCILKGRESVESPLVWGSVSKEWKLMVVRDHPVGWRGTPTSIVWLDELLDDEYKFIVMVLECF